MGVASGPVSFMSLFDASTDVVKQGGTRRGANMGILRVDHPDILEFITCKDDTTKITNFNISVAVTDAFMAAVEADGMYDLIHPKTGKVVGQLNAREVWAKIIHGAWKTGEPGVFFIDRANHYNPVPHLGAYEATNPCGEQPLLPYDVCNLGSINLGAFVRDGQIDWDGLRQVVHLSTHFLENVIDANQYPLPEITELAQRIRRIGLGVMGLADVFVKLGIPYDSDEGVALGRKIQQFVDEEAKVESRAAGRGSAARSRSGSGASGVRTRPAARGPKGERIRPMRRLRNCNVTTVAPTGTISIIAGCSSGIEPLFAVAFMRNQAGVLMPDVNEDFVAIAKREGWYSEELMRRIAEAGHIDFPRGARASGSGCSSPPTTSSPSGTSGCRRRSRSTTTPPSPRPATSPTTRPRSTSRRSTGSPTASIARASRSTATAAATCRCCRTGTTAKKVQEQATSSGKAEARADLATLAGTAAASGDRAAIAAVPSSRARWPSSTRRTSGSAAWCTSSRPRICSGARSGHGPSSCAAPPAGSRRRSARSTSRSPRTTGGSRSRSS